MYLYHLSGLDKSALRSQFTNTPVHLFILPLIVKSFNQAVVVKWNLAKAEQVAINSL